VPAEFPENGRRGAVEQLHALWRHERAGDARAIQLHSNLEIYSIDEAFLSFAGFEARCDEHARDLRRTVQQWTGIPVSVGIAPTKTLAKVANRLAKKDTAAGGVRLLLGEQREALGRLELTDLWGIAGRLAERLRAIGVTTPLELRDADHRLIRERFSVVLERMVLELRGIACLGLEEVTPDRKSLVASRFFGRPIENTAGARRGGFSYGARGRKDAPAESRDGEHSCLGADQQLQAR
jgi:DNA polymerase V